VLTFDGFVKFAESLEAKLPVFRGFPENLRKHPDVVTPFLPKLEKALIRKADKLRAQGLYLPPELFEEAPTTEAAPMTEAELHASLWRAFEAMSPEQLKEVTGLNRQQIEAVRESFGAA